MPDPLKVSPKRTFMDCENSPGQITGLPTNRIKPLLTETIKQRVKQQLYGFSFGVNCVEEGV